MAARDSEPLQSSPGLGYVRELDGIRAIAILMVMVTHFYLGEWPSLAWAPWGELGVRIFFVLSGYLITGILLSCRAIRERDPSRAFSTVRMFYARRFLRIFPVYYGLLILLYSLGVPGVVDHFGWHLSYTTNLRVAWTNSYMVPAGHLWSLSVEEQFYLVWPWIIVFSRERWLRRTVLAVIALGPLSRAVAIALGQTHMAETHWTTSCLDTLGFGSLLAIYSQADVASRALRERLVQIARVAGPALLVAALAVRDFDISPHLAWVASDLGIALSTVWLIDHVVRMRRGPVCTVLAWAPLVSIGKISYGLYLYHRFVQWGVPIALGQLGLMQYYRGAVPLLLGAGLSIGVAQLSWVLYERPINRLKRHFRYSTGSESTVA